MLQLLEEKATMRDTILLNQPKIEGSVISSHQRNRVRKTQDHEIAIKNVALASRVVCKGQNQKPEALVLHFLEVKFQLIKSYSQN